jgi:hypothetical protein
LNSVAVRFVSDAYSCSVGSPADESMGSRHRVPRLQKIIKQLWEPETKRSETDPDLHTEDGGIGHLARTIRLDEVLDVG